MRNWVWVQECGKSGPGARAGGEGRGPSRGQAAVSVGGGGAWPGFKPMRRAAEQRPGPTGVEGAGGTGGPGCGARGRRRRLTDNTLTTSTARLEAAAGPAGPGRASRRRAERSSQRGRRAGGQATRRPEIWRGIATPEIWRAAAHGAARPDTTHGARNTSGTTQEVKPQKRNEKCPYKQRHSQLHSNTPKSHMGNMRAS